MKNKGAGNGLWQNIEGSVKGVAVNLLIDPLTVETVGHRAMLDFGRAVVSGTATFTFPQAKNLKLSSSAGQQPCKREHVNKASSSPHFVRSPVKMQRSAWAAWLIEGPQGVGEEGHCWQSLKSLDRIVIAG